MIKVKLFQLKNKKSKMPKLGTIKWHLMSTLTQLILAALLAMTLYWNGIVFYAEFMEAAGDLTCSTRPIRQPVFIKPNKKPKKLLSEV